MCSQNSFHRAFVLSFIIARSDPKRRSYRGGYLPVIPHMVGAVDGSERALLQGTLEIALGDYIITNGEAKPLLECKLNPD